MITRERAETEMAKGLGLHMDRYFARARERYVLDYVKSELIKEYGVETARRGGFRVYTTIDLKYQRWAREAIADNLAGVGPSSAIVTIDPKNGDILAMASSSDYAQVEVQPRRPGPPPARLGVQDHGADDRPARGREPELDELRLALADEDRLAGGCGAPFEIKTYSAQGRRQHEPAPRDAGLRQLGLHPARRRPRPGQGQGDGADDGHQVQADGLLRRDAGRARGRRLAARDGQRLRDDRQRRLPQPAARDPQDHDPRGPAEAPGALAREPHEGVLGRRDLRGDQDPRRPTSRAARAARRRSAAPRAARPARRTRTSTPGSSASRRGCPPPSGSASPVGQDLDERRSFHGAQHRRRHVPGPDLGRLHEARPTASTAATSSSRPSRSRASRSSATTRARAARTRPSPTTRRTASRPPEHAAGSASPRRTRRRDGGNDEPATASRAATTTRPSIPNQYETPPQDAAEHRDARAAARRRPATADSGPPDWYNLRRQGRRRAAMVGMREGSAGSTPRACWI